LKIEIGSLKNLGKREKKHRQHVQFSMEKDTLNGASGHQHLMLFSHKDLEMVLVETNEEINYQKLSEIK